MRETAHDEGEATRPGNVSFPVELERLIDEHKDAVYRQLVRVCGNYDDAEDALANALYAALRAADQLQDPARFRGWLSTIGTRSCARMRIRNRLVEMTSLDYLESNGFEVADDSARPDMEAAKTTMKRCVSDAIESLDAPHRDVYVRRELLGHSAEEVARQLQITVSAVKSRLHRARQHVRHALDTGFDCAT